MEVMLRLKEPMCDCLPFCGKTHYMGQWWKSLRKIPSIQRTVFGRILQLHRSQEQLRTPTGELVHQVYPEKIKKLHEIAILVFDACGIEMPRSGYTSYKALLDKKRWERNTGFSNF
jgi:hypothetical protein